MRGWLWWLYALKVDILMLRKWGHFFFFLPDCVVWWVYERNSSPKMKILSPFTHPRAISNIEYDFLFPRNTKDFFIYFFGKQYTTCSFPYNKSSKWVWVLSNSRMTKSTIKVSGKYAKSSKVIQQHCVRNRVTFMMLLIENLVLTGLTGVPMFLLTSEIFT